MWQDLIAIGMVLVAIGYLAYRLLGRAKRGQASGCGVCSNCPSEQESPPPIVPITNLSAAPRAHSEKL